MINSQHGQNYWKSQQAWGGGGLVNSSFRYEKECGLEPVEVLLWSGLSAHCMLEDKKTAAWELCVLHDVCWRKNVHVCESVSFYLLCKICSFCVTVKSLSCLRVFQFLDNKRL